MISGKTPPYVQRGSTLGANWDVRDQHMPSKLRLAASSYEARWRLRRSAASGSVTATMVRRVAIGFGLGAVAGVLDVAPMVAQGLTWDANLSAFTMWLVVGFIVSVVELPLPSPVQGIVIAFLCLAPSAILIGWHEPIALLPIGVMTTALGALLGYGVRRLAR